MVRDAWRLAKSYWISEEKRSAWGLLFAVVVLNLSNVYVSGLQKLDGGEFFR